VVADSGSNVYVAWHDWYTDFDIFFAKSTNSGSSWSAATRLAASGYQVYPSLAYANAVLGLSYADNSYGNYEIAIRKSTNQGASWGSPVRVTGDSGSSVNPSIRLDSAGANYLITWVDTRGNSNSWYDVYFQKVAA
jgi:hypothetical protein